MDSNGSPRTASLWFKGKNSPLRSSCKPAAAQKEEGGEKPCGLSGYGSQTHAGQGSFRERMRRHKVSEKAYSYFCQHLNTHTPPQKTKKEKQMIVPKGCRTQWNVMVAHRGYSEGREWESWEGKVEYFINGKII